MILACDPGHTTGFAYLGLDETIVKHGTFPFAELDQYLERLQRLSRSYTVIEYVVPNRIDAHNMMLAELNVCFKRAFPNALFIRPGLWKPIANATFRKDVRKKLGKVTAHEIDAVCIALYALRHRKTALAEQLKVGANVP